MDISKETSEQAALQNAQKAGGRYLGLDYGEKRIGLAISDETAAMAFSHATIPNDEKALPAVVALCAERGIVGLVMGESKDFAMQDNPVMAKARLFGEALSTQTGLPLNFEPEFLTSHQARTVRHELGATSQKGDGAVDAGAAALILQTHLDRMKFAAE